MVTDSANVPVYVHISSADHVRTTALRSHAPQLRQFIQKQHETDPSWTLSEHVKLIDGCPNGVPADRADAFKCYFIVHLDTVCDYKDGAWNGKCNLKHGNHFTRHFEQFDSIRQELANGPIVVEREQDTTLAEATAEEAIFHSIMVDTADEDGTPLESTHEAYKLVRKYYLTLRSESNAHNMLQHTLLPKYAALKSSTVSHAEFATDWNAIKADIDELGGPDSLLDLPENQPQQFLWKQIKSAHKQTSCLVGNGEEALIAQLPPLLKTTALESIKTLLWMVHKFDKNVDHSFKSSLAWTRPSFKRHKNGQPQGKDEALRHLADLLAKPWLTQAQRKVVLKRRDGILDGSIW